MLAILPVSRLLAVIPSLSLALFVFLLIFFLFSLAVFKAEQLDNLPAVVHWQAMQQWESEDLEHRLV